MVKLFKLLLKGILYIIKFLYKLIKRFLLILTVLIVLLVVGAHFYLDSIAKDKIQLYLDDIPGISSKIGKVRISFIPPSIEIDDVVIKNGNPNEVWKRVEIERIRINPNLQSLKKNVLEIESINVIEPNIFCDVGKIDLTNVINNNIGTGIGKGANDIKKGFLGGLKEIFKGNIGSGLLKGLGNMFKGTVEVTKTVANPGSIFKKKEKNPSTIESKKEKIIVVVDNIYLKQPKFIPEQDILWLKSGQKINLPDINFTNVNNNSRDNIVKNIEDVVTNTITKILTDSKK